MDIKDKGPLCTWVTDCIPFTSTSNIPGTKGCIKLFRPKLPPVCPSCLGLKWGISLAGFHSPWTYRKEYDIYHAIHVHAAPERHAKHSAAAINWFRLEQFLMSLPGNLKAGSKQEWISATGEIWRGEMLFQEEDPSLLNLYLFLSYFRSYLG